MCKKTPNVPEYNKMCQNVVQCTLSLPWVATQLRPQESITFEILRDDIAPLYKLSHNTNASACQCTEAVHKNELHFEVLRDDTAP